MKYYTSTTQANIRNWPESERPRERLLKLGPQHLSDAQLLAVILGCGTAGKNAIELGRELVANFKGLRGLFGQEQQELLATKGLGKAKVGRLLAVTELSRRIMREKIESRSVIHNETDVISYLTASMQDLRQEFFKTVYLNASHRVLEIEDSSRGTVNEAAVYPREILSRAFTLGATALIFVHNHPSGNLNPSTHDLVLTERLIQTCTSVKIDVLDHIIISPQGYRSLKAAGYF